MKLDIIRKLQSIVGAENVLTEEVDLFCYSYDGSFHQAQRVLPGVVVLPGNVDETACIMRIAYENETPVVVRGAGSNLSGGCIPINDCIVMQMTRMNRIKKIDPRNMIAIVEPGVINGVFQEMLAKYRLFYPPDPASLGFSTLGGNVAECAGGPRCVKYGVTRDYVLSLEVVLADGRIVRVGAQTMKSVAGYDLARLFVGSEGTLGVITEITVKLLPLPESRSTVLASFRDINQTAETVVEILAQGIVPASLELMDKIYIANIEGYMPSGLPLDADAVLLIEVDGPEVGIGNEVKQVEQVCLQQGAVQVTVAKNAEERERLWQARRGAYGAVARNYPTIISEDVTVPRDKIPDAVRTIRKIAEKYELTIAIIAHAGDGNLHASILTDESNLEEVKRVHDCLPDLFKEALELGGTITGEHGVGLTKVPFLPWEVGENGIQIMAGIKQALDPKNILNPGKLFRNRSN